MWVVKAYEDGWSANLNFDASVLHFRMESRGFANSQQVLFCAVAVMMQVLVLPVQLPWCKREEWVYSSQITATNKGRVDGKGRFQGQVQSSRV